VAVKTGNPLEEASQGIDLTAHMFLDDQAFFVVREVIVGPAHSSEICVYFIYLGLICFSAKKFVDVVQEVIAGCPLDRPLRRQPFLKVENFLNDYICVVISRS